MARKIPLDGLDRVDWASLEHAYGPATDVPEMLRELAGEGSASRAFDWLFSSLYHQGSVYSATSAAIPFLIQILEQGRRRELVHFLGSVAESGVESIGLELGKAVGVLARLLGADDPGERESAARALGVVSDLKDKAIEALRGAIEIERDQQTRAAMAEALAGLDGKFEPPQGASPIEKFRAACAAARREQAGTPGHVIHQIVANWPAVLAAEESDAGEMVMLGRTFPRATQLGFYAALLAQTNVPLETAYLAQELLVVAFDDRRRWAGYAFPKTRFFDGKHWTMFTAGGSSWFVPAEENMAFYRALAEDPSPAKAGALIDRLKGLSRHPPANAPQGWCCQFNNVTGRAPAWQKPFNADQRLAVEAISQCDAIWELATNLWFLFNLPADRAGFAGLLDRKADT